MKVTLVFIHVLNSPEFLNWTRQFLNSYRNFPPDYPHNTIVVFNNGKPTDADREMFSSLPEVSYFLHNNEGSDIGGFLAVSKILTCDLGVFFGNTAYVQRRGWMVRMVEAAKKHGLGMYGSLATVEVSHHLATTGFWCNPIFLTSYPIKVVTKAHRYDFEHGPNALWRMVVANGFPALLVTWCGEYAPEHWRKPPNIYRRGDQSNCVTFYRHSTTYGLADPALKRILEGHADTLY